MTARTLRVLVLDQGRGLWGAQRYLLRLAPLLRERGVELTLAGPRSLALHDAWQGAGFEAIDLDLPIERSIRESDRPSVRGTVREAGNSLRGARMIAARLRRGDYDALWANGHWTHVEGSVAGWARGKPVVLHLHEEAVPGLGRFLRTVAVRIATQTVAVSEVVAAGLPPGVSSRVIVIPNGVDTQVMSPTESIQRAQLRDLRAGFGIGDSEVLVLAATRLDPVKRIEDLLDAVRNLDDRRIKLVIAGATSGYPEYERDVRALASELPSRQVIFAGNRESMADLFRASDVVIHAGIVEGMPLGLLEAQSCAKPVVAYRVAGVPEAVLDGTTGLLVDACDVPGLTKALRTLTTDASLRAEMGAAARAHVLARHRIEVQADRNAEVLTDMCLGSCGTAK